MTGYPGWREWVPPSETFVGGERGGKTARLHKMRATPVIVTADLAIIDAQLAKANGVQGEYFQSKKEANCYIMLRERERLGFITDLQRQVKIELYAVDPEGLKHVVGKHFCDFTYTDVQTGKKHYVEVKGRTPEKATTKKARSAAQADPVYRYWNLKRKMAEVQLGITIVVL